MDRRNWRFLSGVVLFAGAAGAQSVASIPIHASVSREPIWHDYGYDVRNANGQVTHLPMEVPFFRTIRVNTTVYVSLDNINTVVEKMQARRVNGNTDLMVAAAAGDNEAVRALLRKVVLVNARHIA